MLAEIFSASFLCWLQPKTLSVLKQLKPQVLEMAYDRRSAETALSHSRISGRQLPMEMT